MFKIRVRCRVRFKVRDSSYKCVGVPSCPMKTRAVKPASAVGAHLRSPKTHAQQRPQVGQ